LVRAFRYASGLTPPTCAVVTPAVGHPGQAGSENTWECRDLGLFYQTDGKLWRARWSQWNELSDGEGGLAPVPGSLEYTAAREFYYDGPRQRYLTQEVDPTTWEVLPEGPGEPTQAFTTYLGEMPWADFTVDADWTPTKVRDYVTGDGLHAQKGTADPANVEFLHGDLIGSTMLTTSDSGAPVQGITYTAFGEPVFNDGSGWQVSGALPEGYPRYAYAGQFGYESDLLTVQGTNETLAPVTLAHVGWRWYQPGIGRFVQRDPAGLAGGLNVYEYAAGSPNRRLDPSGLLSIAPGTAPPQGGVLTPGEQDPPITEHLIVHGVEIGAEGAAQIASGGEAGVGAICVFGTVAGGLGVVGDLGPILGYVAARNSAIRGDWDSYERWRRAIID
jgi:RHS repeat-associated protein